MSTDHYDLIILGGGPTGFAGAMRALDFGKRVLLVEKTGLGGTEVFNGVMTSKTLWEYSKKVRQVRDMVPSFQLKFENSDREVREAVRTRRNIINNHIRVLLDAPGKSRFGLEKGRGELVDQHTVLITRNQGEPATVTYTADNILLATGSRPRYLPNIPIDEKVILTSDGIRNMRDFQKSLVVLGAGVIGCEFATIFSNFGNSEVFLIDKADRILPFEDEDVASIVAESLEKNGCHVHRGASLVRMDVVNGEVEYELEYKDGRREVNRVGQALVSVGRVPNVEGLGLGAAGIRLTERGGIWRDDTQTNIPTIYAAGDVATEISLVNVGESEARHAVERMYGEPQRRLSYENISTIMFLDPEVAAVGINEQEAVRRGLPVRVVKLDYSLLSRAIAMHKTKGFFKIIVTNDHAMRILGMRAIGAHASSCIEGVAYLVHTQQGIRDLANMIHPHPSIIEGIQEALRMLLGTSIYKPEVLGDRLQCYLIQNGIKSPLESIL
ncbi:MAG: NAD(P)/FAD-dependent oxidoreductase [Spirochaetales bacterium]